MVSALANDNSTLGTALASSSVFQHLSSLLHPYCEMAESWLSLRLGVALKMEIYVPRVSHAVRGRLIVAVQIQNVQLLAVVVAPAPLLTFVFVLVFVFTSTELAAFSVDAGCKSPIFITNPLRRAWRRTSSVN